MGNTYHKRFETIHGFDPQSHPLYNVWANLKSRCQSPSDPAFCNYGGRGIEVCERWQHFANFAIDMFPSFEPGLTINRIDNDGNYEPSNCNWADDFEQMRNRRTFKNNTSGFKGVVPKKNYFIARYDDRNVRFNLGAFDTAEQAKEYRDKFIELYLARDPRAFDMTERRLNRNSTTGISGVTKHTDGGYIVRRTVNGTRQYLGYSKTLEVAIEMLNYAD